MQTKWDDFETAFELYYPCQVFMLAALQWAIRKYRRIIVGEGSLEAEAEWQASDMMTQLETKMNLVTEKENVLDTIRFLLRNVRDTAAACARLVMKDEWEIYVSWQRAWLAACGKSERRRKQVRIFLQLAAEYWHGTQPSRSHRQWGKMDEVMQPSLLNSDATLQAAFRHASRMLIMCLWQSSPSISIRLLPMSASASRKALSCFRSLLPLPVKG